MVDRFGGIRGAVLEHACAVDDGIVTTQQSDQVRRFRLSEVDGHCAFPRPVDHFGKVITQVPEVGHHFPAYQA